MPFFQKDLPLPMLKPCSRPPSAPRAVTCGNLHLRTSVHLWHIKRMCLGTFSRLARSLATIYIFARVRIIGTLVPFCVIGNRGRIYCYVKKHYMPMIYIHAMIWFVTNDYACYWNMLCTFFKISILIPGRIINEE